MLDFTGLGLMTRSVGGDTLHIFWQNKGAPCGIFQKDMKTNKWFFCGTGWSRYSSEWLIAFAGELDKMNKASHTALAETVEKL